MGDRLKDFITSKRELGLTDSEIREKLLNAGWRSEDVDRGLKGEVEDDVPRPDYNEEKPKSSGMKDVDQWVAFEHVLMFISLFVFVIATTLLLGEFINKWIPNEKTNSAYSYLMSVSSYQQTIVRSYMATIIVSYPLFAFLFLRTTRRIKMNPEEQFLPSRRKLIYVTLVATFLVFFVGVITIIYRMISGDLNLNAVTHLLMRMGISGFIFGYYLIEVRKSHEKI